MNAKPFGKWIDWVDGKPVPKYTAPMTAVQIKDILPAALALPYEPVIYRRKNEKGELEEYIPESEEILRGLTNAEVIAYRRVLAAANPHNENSLQDARFCYENTIGKPTLTVNSTELRLTYSDILAKWHAEEEPMREELLKLEEAQRQQWVVVEQDKDGRDITPEHLRSMHNGETIEVIAYDLSDASGV